MIASFDVGTSFHTLYRIIPFSLAWWLNIRKNAQKSEQLQIWVSLGLWCVPHRLRSSVVDDGRTNIYGSELQHERSQKQVLIDSSDIVSLSCDVQLCPGHHTNHHPASLMPPCNHIGIMNCSHICRREPGGGGLQRVTSQRICVHVARIIRISTCTFTCTCSMLETLF